MAFDVSKGAQEVDLLPTFHDVDEARGGGVHPCYALTAPSDDVLTTPSVDPPAYPRR